MKKELGAPLCSAYSVFQMQTSRPAILFPALAVLLLIFASCSSAVSSINTPSPVASSTPLAAKTVIILGTTPSPAITPTAASLATRMINKPTITPTPVQCKPTIDNDANQYIGAQIPPYPDKIEEKSGALVESSDGPRYDYGLDYLSNGSIQMVWFSQSLGYRDADGHIVWTVIDTLSLPKLKSGEAVALLTCYQDGKLDREIFAIFSEPRNYVAVQAWRANRQTCKIEPISSDGIVCPP